MSFNRVFINTLVPFSTNREWFLGYVLSNKGSEPPGPEPTGNILKTIEGYTLYDKNSAILYHS